MEVAGITYGRPPCELRREEGRLPLQKERWA